MNSLERNWQLRYFTLTLRSRCGCGDGVIILHLLLIAPMTWGRTNVVHLFRSSKLF